MLQTIFLSTFLSLFLHLLLLLVPFSQILFSRPSSLIDVHFSFSLFSISKLCLLILLPNFHLLLSFHLQHSHLVSEFCFLHIDRTFLFLVLFLLSYFPTRNILLSSSPCFLVTDVHV